MAISNDPNTGEISMEEFMAGTPVEGAPSEEISMEDFMAGEVVQPVRTNQPSPRPAPVARPVQPIPVQPAPNPVNPVATASAPVVQKTVEVPKEQARGAWARFRDEYVASAQSGAGGWIARNLFDVFNVYNEDVRKQFPGQTEEWYEDKTDQIVAQTQRRLLEEQQKAHDADPQWRADESWVQNVLSPNRWAPAITGMLGGSASPIDLVNPFAKVAGWGGVAGRVGSQAALNAGEDAVIQADAITDGVQDSYDLAKTGMAGLFGGMFRSAFEVPQAARLATGRTDPLAPKTEPEVVTPQGAGDIAPQYKTLPPAAEAQYTELLKTGSYEQMAEFSRKMQETYGISPDMNNMASYIKARDEGKIKDFGWGYRDENKPGDNQAEMDFTPAPEGELKLQGGSNPAPIQAPRLDQSVDNSDAALDEGVAYVNDLTKDWKNAPQYEVYKNFDDLAEQTGLDPDSIGAYSASRGKVFINMKAAEAEARYSGVATKDILSAVTFHEGLAHHGLAQKFGDGLDDLMIKMYDNSPGLKNEVDQWLRTHGKAYELDMASFKDRALAVEETLAALTESGRIRPSLRSKIMHYIKQFGRQMGLKLNYSTNEYKTILGMAHNATINGKGRDVAGNGFRLKQVWHGSGADFDNFDHSYMSSGEGVQAFGWGTYLTETKKIADAYHTSIGTTETRFKGGEPEDELQVINKLAAHLEETFPGRDSDIANVVTARASLDKSGDLTAEEVAEFLFEFEKPFNEDFSPETRAKIEVYKDQIKDVIEETNRTYSQVNSGRVYEVEIPDDAKWVMWDKPVSATPGLKKALEDAGIKFSRPVDLQRAEAIKNSVSAKLTEAENEWSRAESLYEDAQDLPGSYSREDINALESEVYSAKKAYDDAAKSFNRVHQNLGPMYSAKNMSGEEAYKALVDVLGTPKAASEHLAKHGFAGNKYLDGVSRGVGDGSYNYVIFKADTGKITAKYMKGGNPTSAGFQRPNPKDSRFQREDTLARRRNKAAQSEETYEDWAAKYGLDPVTRKPLYPDDPRYSNVEQDTNTTSAGFRRPRVDDRMIRQDQLNRRALKDSQSKYMRPAKPFTDMTVAEVPRGETVGDNLAGNFIKTSPYGVPIEESGIVERLTDALTSAAKLSKQQKELITKEKGQRLAKLADKQKNTSGEAGFEAERSALGGAYTKVDFPGVRESFTQDEIDGLFDHIKGRQGLSLWDQVNARTGLAKLLDGSVPTASEIKLLGQVFPKEFIRATLTLRTPKDKVYDNLSNALNLPRSLMATADFSAPFRQGVFLVGRKEFWKSVAPMFKYFKDKDAFEELDLDIRSRETYPLMQEAKLYLGEVDMGLNAREEDFMSDWAKKIPGFGKIVSSSERAYVGFLNKLRADTFDSLVDLSRKAGVDFNADPKALTDIARFLNAATGRGSLGRFEDSGPLLNAMFFSPRLVSSRVTLLNPVTYVKLSPVVRQEALKSAMSFGMIGTTVATLAAMAGYDVETDPRSSDFGKLKIDDKTRYDIFGGFTQYVTLGARLATGEKKSLKGSIIELEAGTFNGSRWDTLLKFGRNKLSPVVGYGATALHGEDPVGKDFNLTDDTAKLFVPLIVQDMGEMMKEYGPVQGAAMTVPAAFGMGVSAYNTGGNEKTEAPAAPSSMLDTPAANAAEGPTISAPAEEISMEEFLSGELIQEGDKPVENVNAESIIKGMGLNITDSGVRSFEDQQRYYNQAGGRGVSAPGTSSHEFGNAIDISVPSNGVTVAEVKRALNEAGYENVKIITKTHGTGPHWHIQWGGRGE